MNVANAAGAQAFQTRHFHFNIVGFNIQMNTAAVIDHLYVNVHFFMQFSSMRDLRASKSPAFVGIQVTSD